MKPLSMLNADRFYREDLAEQIPAMKHGKEKPDEAGVFMFATKTGPLRVVATVGGGWDHVSVSREDRTPSWEDMDYIYRKFFWSTETAVQYMLSASEKINIHPYCLHLWRPNKGGVEIPKPPKEYV